MFNSVIRLILQGLIGVFALLPWTMSAIAAESSDAAVKRLTAQTKPPPGVVFEIVSANEADLDRAIPLVSRHARALRKRFPKLPIAVVTHGREMFALQTDRRAERQAAHSGVEALTKDDIPVHVCETYAGMRSISAEAFPSYVDVAPSGPSQIKSYLELGYVLIRV